MEVYIRWVVTDLTEPEYPDGSCFIRMDRPLPSDYSHRLGVRLPRRLHDGVVPSGKPRRLGQLDSSVYHPTTLVISAFDLLLRCLLGGGDGVRTLRT